MGASKLPGSSERGHAMKIASRRKRICTCAAETTSLSWGKDRREGAEPGAARSDGGSCNANIQAARCLIAASTVRGADSRSCFPMIGSDLPSATRMRERSMLVRLQRCAITASILATTRCFVRAGDSTRATRSCTRPTAVRRCCCTGCNALRAPAPRGFRCL